MQEITNLIEFLLSLCRKGLNTFERVLRRSKRRPDLTPNLLKRTFRRARRLPESPDNDAGADHYRQ
jgi:hypothetical protein